MFFRINGEEIKENKIVYFDLADGLDPIPSRIVRVDHNASDLAYVPFCVKEIHICDKLSPDDYYIQSEYQYKKTVPDDWTIAELSSRQNEVPYKQRVDTFMRFTGSILKVSKANAIINEYSKDLDAGVYYIDVVSKDDCKFTIRLPFVTESIDKLQEGVCIDAIVSTECFIINY